MMGSRLHDAQTGPRGNGVGNSIVYESKAGANKVDSR